MAARAEPIAKVRAMVPFTLIPIRVAAPLSSETANMAWPDLDLLMKVVKPSMMMIQVRMVTMVSPVMVICPSASLMAGMVTTDVNDFVSAPNISRATFCSR